MNFFKLKPLLSLLCLSLLASLISSCVTIQEAHVCSAAGLISSGGICSHLISSETETLSFHELLDFLDAQPVARNCIPVGYWGVVNKQTVWVQTFPVCADDQTQGTLTVLPTRGAAMIMSSDDWGTLKTELETACRYLGNQCSLATQAIIARMNSAGNK